MVTDENKNSTVESESHNQDEEIEVIDSTENETKEEDSNTAMLENEIQSLKNEKDEISNRLLRLQAEFDNFKKRTQKEKEANLKYKSQDLVAEMLPAMDNFERALQVETNEANSNLVEGISMVYRQLQDALKSQGVEVIESIGKEFDPNLHHAVMQIEDANIESNTVVEELQKGYMLKDKVVRPAMVKVNK